MYQRNMRPTVGALRRTLAADVAATPKCPSRAFSGSARRFDESSGDAAPSAPAPPKPDSRKARAANALSQITRLGANRRIQPGGLAKGSFPSGQTDGQLARGPPRTRPEGGLKITREAVGLRTGGPPSSGAMARAPAQLKLARGPRPAGNATVGGRRGPNLRGRDRQAGGSGAKDQGPKKRERKKGGEDKTKSINPADVKTQDTLSDGMVQHLLRLQRGEWDRKPYEPKYAAGSFAANELIHAGRELFRGEAPPVKIWGMLEKRIGVVGMHNAEAHLKVRRVTHLDDESLGERRQHFETGDVDVKVPAKAPAKAVKAAPVKAAPAKAPAAKAPAKQANAPAAAAQAAPAKVPAPKKATVVQ